MLTLKELWKVYHDDLMHYKLILGSLFIKF